MVAPILFCIFFCKVGTLGVFQRIAKDFYGDDVQLAFNAPQAACGLIGFVTVPILGSLSDRYGRKPLLIFCSLSFSFPYLLLWALNLTSSKPNYSWFLISQVFSGLSGSETGSLGLCFAYIADCVAPDRRAAASGLIMALGAGTGYCFGPLFFAWLYQEGERLELFKTVLAASCVIWILITLVIPESNPPSGRVERPPLQCSDFNPAKSFRLILGGAVSPRATQHLRVLFFVVLLLYVMKMGLIFALGLFAAQVFEFDTQQSSLMNSVYGGFQAFGQLSISVLLVRLSQKQAVTLGVALGLVACSIPALPLSVITGDWLYPAEAALALSFIVFTMCVAMATQLVPPECAGEAAQLINTALTLCAGLGPALFGLLVQATVKTSYPGGALLVFVVIVAFDLCLCSKLPTTEQIRECRMSLADGETG